MKSSLEFSDWKEKYNGQVALLKDIKENVDTLRFDNRYIKVSEVASQYYCEKKVELKYIHGDIETESKILGREGHDELVEEFGQVTLKAGWEKIFTSPLLSLSEFLFFAKYKNSYLVFKPDRVLFVNGIPKLLVEFKFSKYRRPFISHHVQLRAEGILLKKLGFDVSSLHYAIIISPINAERDSELLNEIPTLIHNKLNSIERGKPLNFGNMNTFVYKLETGAAKKNLKWAIEYWKERREAQMTDNEKKCRSCEYNDSCDKKKP